MEKKLTNKERLFVLEYLIDLDPRRAAISAGFSKTMARTKAYQWVSNSKIKPHVQKAIKQALKKREERTERTGDEVVKRLWEHANLDVFSLVKVDDGGSIQAIPPDQLPKGTGKLISKIKEKRTIVESSDGSKQTMFGTIEYELPEKTKCLEMLGRHYGIFNDKLILTVDNLPELLDAARKRLKNRP